MTEHTPNSPVLTQLLTQFEQGHLAPCSLFYGEPQAGQFDTAWKLGTHILMQDNPMGWNESITQKFMEQRTHPNFWFVEPAEGGSEIQIQEARALLNFLQSTPSINGWRFVLMNSADILNNAAANALLKILEELPSRVIIVMLAYNLSKVKNTLLSRSHKIFFPAKGNSVADYCAENAWAQKALQWIDLALQRKNGVSKEDADDFKAQPERQAWLPKIVLYRLHAKATDSNASPEEQRLYADRYASVAAFVSRAQGRALAPAHILQTIFLLLSAQSKHG